MFIHIMILQIQLYAGIYSYCVDKKKSQFTSEGIVYLGAISERSWPWELRFTLYQIPCSQVIISKMFFNNSLK